MGLGLSEWTMKDPTPYPAINTMLTEWDMGLGLSSSTLSMIVNPDDYIYLGRNNKFRIISGLQPGKPQFSLFPPDVEIAPPGPSSIQRRLSGHASPPE